jgi:uncharacterized protein YidB (DUF937 family)
MGVFDAVSQAAVSVPGAPGGNPILVSDLIRMLGSATSGSGLLGVIQAFERQGLGPLVSSWVGTGQNMPVSPAQVQQGLGAGVVQRLAQSAGLSEGAAATALATLLPSIIDRLTPSGRVPHASQLGAIVASLESAVGA